MSPKKFGCSGEGKNCLPLLVMGPWLCSCCCLQWDPGCVCSSLKYEWLNCSLCWSQTVILLALFCCRSSFPCWYLLHKGSRSWLYWCLCGVSTSDTCNPATRRYISLSYWSRRDWDLPGAVAGKVTPSGLQDKRTHHPAGLFQLAEWHAGPYIPANSPKCQKSKALNTFIWSYRHPPAYVDFPFKQFCMNFLLFYFFVIKCKWHVSGGIHYYI
jgi:hypothetical protein